MSENPREAERGSQRRGPGTRDASVPMNPASVAGAAGAALNATASKTASAPAAVAAGAPAADATPATVAGAPAAAAVAPAAGTRRPPQGEAERGARLGWPRAARPDLSLLEPQLAERYGFSLVRRLGALPACRRDDVTVVWVRPDLDWSALLEVQAEFGVDFQPLVVSDEMFNLALQRVFEGAAGAEEVAQGLDEAIDLENASVELPETADLLDSRDDAPIIRLLNAVMVQAVKEKASDIHIEPFESRLVIRFRVDGMLRDAAEAPVVLAGRIIARVKVLARLDIAEKRVPQDGRISLRLGGRLIDVRISTLPTHYGERVVMRILEKEQGILTLEQIGMPAAVREQFIELIRAPYGIFLVTGPTGSGKTTTLYAALQQVNSPDLNIITVEDPVEYDLAGVGQIPVNVKTGMTFDKGLRAILRQDPDVIMVGEIRDVETAQVAVQASLTGHRVFSTLHTNDAVGSVTRLVDMDIEPYLVASSLLGALAQRLVRKLCTACRVPHAPDAGERQLLGAADGDLELYRPGGCEACFNTGYRGRTGIYELMIMDEKLRRLVHDQHGERELRRAARDNAMRSLRDDGIAKVCAGVTSLEEVLRVSHH